MEHGLGQTFTGEQLLFEKCQSGEKLMSLNTGIKRCATTDGKAFTPFKILMRFQTHLVFLVSTETCFISNPVWLTCTAAAHLLRALPHFVIPAHITLFHLQLPFGNKAPLGKPWVQQGHLRDPVRSLAQAQHQANEPVQPRNRHLLKLMQGIWGCVCALAALLPLNTDAHHTPLLSRGRSLAENHLTVTVVSSSFNSTRLSMYKSFLQHTEGNCRFELIYRNDHN